MLTLTTLLLVAPVQEAPVTLAWKSVPGELHHDWSTAHHLFVDRVTRTVDGEVVPMDSRFALRTERRLRVTDELQAFAADRPTRFQRRYREAELEVGTQPIGEEEAPAATFKLTSELAGTSVLWTWVPQEEAYGRYYDALEAKESALAPLREDLHLRALLPVGPVAVGQSWDLDPLELEDVLEPGGDLSMSSTGGNALVRRNLGAGVGGGWQHLFTGRATGSVRAKLERVQDGQAFVTVTFDRVRYLADISEYVSSTAMGRETTAGLQIQGGRLTVDLVGEGTLVWDLDRGRAASLELELDQTVDISFEAEIHEKSMVERMKMIGGYAAKYAVSDELPEDE